ncbi:uncharacterized protein TRIVIDRAFT_224773 [Trichoderma virens Gv29-8]|uniref:Uncharacterized protein n=1 Tax=Hypocrea virens (strain Gv29-8 / FGSC 10586) TaxID=413071 RepID=G9N1B7_HYPVG|nr:uncharacterized protein TRIVIDRAFT_224773 [Trichoderma virens Gv29-8]EHK19548.1 hypothetical protein TRIVIDRAFT_224773 [Trichoderma virens Gv29-8]UKZ58194.1 hypothetical protein TrVGV298_012061 [Trichoderma virens]
MSVTDWIPAIPDAFFVLAAPSSSETGTQSHDEPRKPHTNERIHHDPSQGQEELFTSSTGSIYVHAENDVQNERHGAFVYANKLAYITQLHFALVCPLWPQ